jgi:endonuclease I
VLESFWEKQGSQQGFNEDLQDCFEPLDSHKGNVARAMLYFSVRYKKSLTDKQEKLFREWNNLDPVDLNEQIRNDRIEKIQGNRNPFIDDEKLVDQIENFQF